MAGMAAAWQSLARLFAPPARPRRLLQARRLRPFAAVGAGAASSLLLLAVYYATLGLLPTASAYPATDYPVSSWAHRLDMAQFVGTLVFPPTPTALTWWIGLAVWFGALLGLGVVYAFLLAWTLKTSNVFHGLGFGAALFVGLGLTLSVANGFHPALLRNALPDTGLFLLGWSARATLQLLGVHLLYGAVLGTLYQRFSR